MIEIMISVVILGIILGPQIVLLHSAHRYSNLSLFELLAVHYGSELGEQLQKLGPHLKDIRLQTGKDLGEMCSDASFLTPLGTVGGNPFILRLPVPNPTVTDVGFFISPLEPGFVTRTVEVEELDSTDSNLQIWDQSAGIFWRATVGLAWRSAPNDPKVHAASFSFILREDTI